MQHKLAQEQTTTDLCRTNLPTSQKVDLAVLSLATQGDYGSVSALSESFKVSRPTVYEVQQTTSELLERHFDGADATTGVQHVVVVDEAQLRRAIVALRMEGPNALRPIENLIPELYPGLSVSYGKIQGILVEAEERARVFNRNSDMSAIVAAAVDEMYSQGDPVLAGVDLVSGYLSLLGLPLPPGPEQILSAFKSEELIRVDDTGRYEITNLGAILFARDLGNFPGLRRKVMRVIQYRGAGRIQTIKEQTGVKGYASGFEGLIGYINGLLPSNEVMGQALRKTIPMFPELAVREVVANALIHQDFSITGAGPMVEIFEGRIEVTNPGAPIVSTERFLDSPPRSRNEALASLLRRIGICEERGSGIDKVVFETELYQLPAPLFEAPEEATRVTLFAHQPLREMDRDDRVRACYQHACLRYVERKEMTNTTVRKRFGLATNNSATASRLIKEAVDAGMIAPYDSNASRRLMRYVPFWVHGSVGHRGGSCR